MSVKLFAGTTNGLGLKVDERALAQLRQEREDRLKWRRERVGIKQNNGGTPRQVECAVQRMVNALHEEDGCWLWTRGSAKPYGHLRLYTRGWRTHAFVYFLTRYPITMPKQVCHECDTPLCCNPHHLFPGDARINLHNAMTKGRWKPYPRERTRL